MSTSNAPLPDKAFAGSDAPLDEVMLAMDVVDTLRHDQAMLQTDLNAQDRREDLMARLKKIYAAQGIEVPDHILQEGVAALEDERFAYHPPKAGLSRSLGKFYINRAKWGRPLIFIAGLAGLAWTVNYAAIEGPRNAAAKQQAEYLGQLIPNQMENARDTGLGLTDDAGIKTRINTLYDDGMFAAQAGDEPAATAALSRLQDIAGNLRQSYAVRIISRPRESSGVFRLNDDNEAVKNYYLIVEAVTPSGEIVDVTITSQEDQQTKAVSAWGVRVPASVYNDVADDKRDDQIIQNAIIGAKARGALEPQYSVQTSGGYILQW